MGYSYDRTAAHFDPSILGIEPSQLEEMDEDERKEALFDALMRAADLANAIAKAFSKDLGAERAEVVEASRALAKVGRKVR